MSERARLSAVILTKNEEARVARCLESIQWADEIIVVDDMSTDRTVEICERYGAKVVSHPFSGSFGEERNVGNDAATGDWILQLDADDVVSPELRAQIERILREGSPYVAYKFRRKNWFLGHEMRYGGWYYSVSNLLRRGHARYEGLVHERPVVQGTIGELAADIEHHPCESLSDFLARHNRYTTLTAQELLQDRGPLTERQARRLLIEKPWKTFWKSYVKKQGFREGMYGLVFAIFFASVEFLKWAKYWEGARSVPGGAQR